QPAAPVAVRRVHLRCRQHQVDSPGSVGHPAHEPRTIPGGRADHPGQAARLPHWRCRSGKSSTAGGASEWGALEAGCSGRPRSVPLLVANHGLPGTVTFSGDRIMVESETVLLERIAREYQQPDPGRLVDRQFLDWTVERMLPWIHGPDVLE